MYLLLIYFLILVIPLIVMPRYIRSGAMSPYRTVMQATMIIAAAAAVVFLSASMTGQGLFAQLQELIKAVAKEVADSRMVIDTLSLASVSDAERVELITQLYKNTFAVMPVCIMTMGAVVSYIEYIILAKIIGKRKPVTRMPRFREFSFPNSAVMGIIGMYLVTWILTQTGVFADDMMYQNIDFLFDFAFAIQGVSLVLMFCHMKRIPKALGIAAAIVLWITFIGKMLLVMLGMFDLIFGFKGRIKGGRAGRRQ